MPGPRHDPSSRSRLVACCLAAPLAAGIQASPDQGVAFLNAVSLLGPKALHDIRLASRAVFCPCLQRLAELDSLLDRVLVNRWIAASVLQEAKEFLSAFKGGRFDPAGDDPTEEESDGSTTSALPGGPTRRRSPCRGPWVEPRHAFRQLAQNDGELLLMLR